MPGKSAKKKELYLGKSMADLNKLSECKDLGNNVAVIVKSADKTFREALHQDELSDEERAYVLYMRYFNVISMAKKKPDYLKQKDYFDKIIGKKNQLNAIDRAETLSRSLKERYDLVEAEAVAKKLAALEESEEKRKKEKDERKEREKNEQKENGGPSGPPKSEQAVISPMSLFTLLNDKGTEILVMDVRSTEDFRDSHINHKSCINVPVDILKPGTTVNHIGNALPSESRSQWTQRANVDHVILLDWRSTLKDVTIGSTLRTLKDALFKYDASVVLKSEPLVLEGGYEQWLLFYPTVTTNAHIITPAKPEDYITSSGLDFDYPDFEDLTENNKAEPKVNLPVANGNNRPGLPSVDRSLKPKPSSNNINDTPMNNKASESKINNLKNTNVEPQSDKLEGFPRIENSLYPDVVQVMSKSRTDSKPQNVKTRADVKKDTNIEKTTNESADIERELAELSVIKQRKEAELSDFQEERKRMSAEHAARIARLEQEEEKLRSLETLRRKEERDVAELMRQKKVLQEEIKKERVKQDGEDERTNEEEKKRLAELERVRHLEAEKQQRRLEVERLRRDRHRKEEESKIREQKAMEAKEEAYREASERARQEEERRRREVADAEGRAELLREEKERQERERQEKDRRKKEEERRKEEERKRTDDLKIQELKKEKEIQERKQREAREEKARQEKEKAERLRHEEAERAKAEKDRKLAAEKAQKIAEEKMKRVNEPKTQSKLVPTTNLPVGWEKRLDYSTNRYFYINHNQGSTQWEPPMISQPPAAAKETYTTKLKEEPAQSSRGLSRSFSSPDIMKLMSEEGDKPFSSPGFDRTSKPRFQSQMSKPVQRQYIAKKRDLNPVYGSVGPALTGLRNLGNTCYMNSTIQCLNNCTPLVVYFLNDHYQDDINRESSEGMHGEMVDDFAVVVKALWNGQYRCITPRDLKTTVGKYNPMFAGFQQQDSQEFLTFLLDGLHEGLNEVKTRPRIPEQDNDNIPDMQAASLAWHNHKLLHKSIIVELFQGQLKSSLQCKHCNKMSVTYQAFMFLSLPIPHQSRCSLRDCIREFVKPEMMTGSCKWKCPRCKVERDAVKKIDIWKLPPILLIGLNRFVSDGMWMQKKTSYVDFPVTDLDLREHVKDPKSTTKYNLYGISNHYGTMEGGHYTAFCRNPCSKRWYKFDDSEVYEMSSSDVKSSAAFVLYYTSIELSAPKFSPQL